MKRLAAFVLLLAVSRDLLASASLPRPEPQPQTQSSVAEQIAGCQPGNELTLTLATGRKVRGKLLATEGDTLRMQLNDYSKVSYNVTEIRQVRRMGRPWVAWTIYLGILGVVSGVAAWAGSARD